MEQPEDHNNYIKFENDGINIFVNKSIKAKNNLLTIDLSSFLFYKSIDVYGVDINF